ncbi:hypothetical protein [Nonomuraea sp. NPDC050202]|uniref:hypothetical protein n=1 Tax=Nonomuraea sp. NPDC050202 TaxID=3155035 RepID=UPI0033F4A599
MITMQPVIAVVMAAAFATTATSAAAAPVPEPAREYECGNIGLGVTATSTDDQNTACNTAMGVGSAYIRQAATSDGEVPTVVKVGGSTWNCQDVQEFGDVNPHGQCVKADEVTETVKLFS